MIFEEDLVVDERVNLKPNRFKQFIKTAKSLFDYKTIPYVLVLVKYFLQPSPTFK